jgi:DNA-binding transcriptional LysR family regulator
LELYQLRTFVTVAEQSHITQAAEILHLSQPAVTAQIKALEEELGLPLFERGGGGIALSRAGQELLETARNILAQARALKDQAQALRGEIRGRLRLGVVLDPALLRLGLLARRLSEKFPLLDIEFKQGLAGDILNLVRKKELDGGFYFGSNPYSNVEALPLATLNFSVIAPLAWQEKLENASWKDAGKLPWIAPSQFSGYHKLSQDCFRRHNISPRRALEADTEASMLDMVSQGLGLALMREPLAGTAPDTVWRWQPDCETATLSFIYARESADGMVAQEVIRNILDIWQDQGTTSKKPL